ncbi:MAG: phosphodiester glycosidase family protein [Hyphomicrobiales bacterium]
MKFSKLLLLLVTPSFLLSSYTTHAENETRVQDLKFGACQSIQFDGNGYIVCSIEIGTHDLRMFHEKGEPGFWGPSVFGAFDEISGHLAPVGQKLTFAMNGGMYHRDRSAVGLYIADGTQSQSLNTNEGAGNFHLLPNGVFYWDKDQAGVKEANAFRDAELKPTYATQSGPMLVIDGALHPRFIVNGTSLKMRNGVGVKQDGKTVYFAISAQPVNFESFGRLFRDHLKTPNALFLDGGRASHIFAPDLERNDNTERLGPIIAVVEQIVEPGLSSNAGEGAATGTQP